ncbi:MAG: UDP-N-acetylmuramate dehydrogenase [Chloroflexi bacterium]|nr:UDP-N-acetylmuramate dehydrogenase [Chloroflexota bacterium]
MIPHSLVRKLEGIGPVTRDEPLARRTSWRIGGPADLYLIARDRAQLVAALAAAWECETPVFLLGAGSNLLVGDGGIRGLVIENWAQDVTVLDEAPGRRLLVRVESGMPIARAAYRFSRAGWQGLEWAVGIPGTLGGAVVSNAGAHGGTTSEVVRAVRVMTHDEGEVELAAGELGFGYRTSNFLRLWRREGAGPVILSVDLELTAADPQALQGLVAQHTAYRRATQPSQPSGGSVFVNPPGHKAGWLIEHSGLKGHRIGDAQISEKHANFIVNRGRARAAEVQELICLARERVRATFGVALHTEIELVGEGAQGRQP